MVVRNGYLPERTITTGVGEVAILGKGQVIQIT